MKSTLAALLLACAMASGCDLLSNLTNGTTAPTTTTTTTAPTTTFDTFAGTWTSTTSSTPAAGCGNVNYTVTPTSTATAAVTFAATCAGSIGVTGSGAGTLSGSTIDWSAAGLVNQGGVNCPFSFTNGTAAKDSSGNLAVVYSGTVCGIPVSGTETVKK